MAGVPGRSGGKRVGAGRKRVKTAEDSLPVEVSEDTDPLAFLEGVMRGKIMATALQVRAAIAAAQYKHTKRADGGKKDEKQEKAGQVVAGRFRPAKAPLKAVG